MQYIIYKTTNLVNGKYYIGFHKQHGDDFDGYFGSGTTIKKALEKYGKGSFVRETLYTFDNENDAFMKEKEVISEHLEDDNCYNIADGGIGWTGLGKLVVDKGIGIHALTFEQRSEISKRKFTPEYFELHRADFSKGGKIGSAKCKENKSGIFGLSQEDRINIGLKSATTHKQNKTNFFSSEFQSEMSRRGRLSKGSWEWYTNGIKNFQWSEKKTRDTGITLDEFLLDNSQYKRGRVILDRKTPIVSKSIGCRWVNNGVIEMRVPKDEIDEFLASNPDWYFGRSRWKKQPSND